MDADVAPAHLADAAPARPQARPAPRPRVRVRARGVADSPRARAPQRAGRAEGGDWQLIASSSPSNRLFVQIPRPRPRCPSTRRPPSFFARVSTAQVHAFKRELESLYEAVDESLIRNVISFGDSIHERNAIHRVTERMAGVRTKSVKFVERPTIEQLKRQVDLVHGCIEEIVHHTDNLDLMLTIQLLFT